MVVDLSRRRADNQVADRITGEANVGIRAEDMHLGVRNDDTGASGVLDSVFGLAVLAGNTADRAGEVVARQHLHVRHQERLNIQVLQPQQRHSVLDLEAHEEGLDEVLALLDGARVHCPLAGLELDASILGIEADLEKEVLHEGGDDMLPLVAQRRQAVGGAADLAVLNSAALK